EPELTPEWLLRNTINRANSAGDHPGDQTLESEVWVRPRPEPEKREEPTPANCC
ncbi:hypothetical protein LEMLEM_LOCUS19757, partial [Lemmus lemmus]